MDIALERLYHLTLKVCVAPVHLRTLGETNPAPLAVVVLGRYSLAYK